MTGFIYLYVHLTKIKHSIMYKPWRFGLLVFGSLFVVYNYLWLLGNITKLKFNHPRALFPDPLQEIIDTSRRSN